MPTAGWTYRSARSVENAVWAARPLQCIGMMVCTSSSRRADTVAATFSFGVVGLDEAEPQATGSIAAKAPAPLSPDLDEEDWRRAKAALAVWSKGLSRVILGTVAVEDPDLVRQAATAFPGQIAVGIDARGGRVATRGWATETNVMATDLARQFEDAGVAAIIYTDIDRDGAMGGPNIAATEALARAVNIPVIASGGVSSLDDLRALAQTQVIAGAISGRALYDGAIDLGQALALLK